MSLLIIEDNPADRILIQEMLRDSGTAEFRCECAPSLEDGLQRLAEDASDLVLLDLTLPDSWGLATFERLHAAAPTVPVIVLSGTDDEELAVKAVQGGAQDYLVKGQADGTLLARAVRYAIERHRVEQALEQERDLFNTLMDNIPDHIYFKDAQSRFVRINRSLAAKFGLPEPATAVGQTDFDMFTPEHARPAFEDEQRIIRSGQPLVGKVEKETMPNGELTWVLTSKVPRRDRLGRVVGTFGVSKDITELKVMEDVLAAERNLLRAVIDALPDHIYVKDNFSRFLLCNTAVAEFFGLASPEAIVGKWDFDFFPEQAARQFYDEEQTLLASRESRLQRETSVTDQQGNPRWVASTKVVMRNGRGEVTGIVGINHDVTERRRAAEELNQLNADLARSQVELLRTYDNLKRSNDELKATQLRLIQAAKMESVGRLAAGVAHEVKNPLAILLMGVEYLGDALRTHGDEDVKMTLAQMTEAVRRADTIVRGLLEFSASSALQLREESLTAAIEQSLVLVRHALRERRITVVRQLAPGLPRLQLDRPKIEQVLINLFMNALHAMSAGGKLIVTTRQEGEFVLAQVDDTGPGIAPELLPAVFEPFFTTKPTGAGTGLGLSVARNIIEMHGGKLELANRAEGGVRVTMTFNTQHGRKKDGAEASTDG